jgi:hypothetical protein
MPHFQPTPIFRQFLDHYGIDYVVGNKSIWIDNSVNVLHQMVFNNDITWFEKIVNDMQVYPNLDYIVIVQYGSIEMNKLFTDTRYSPIYYGITMLKAAATRYDDNLEIFQLYAQKINFFSSYLSLYDHEYNNHQTLIYAVLSIAIKHGNYHIFHYLATTGKLSKDYQKIARSLKNLVWELDSPNFKILDSLLLEFGYEINGDDLIALISGNQITILEYIIDLIQNRKIIILDTTMKSVIEFARNKSNEINRLFDYLI